ncbi:MAG: 4'-phosphopantetheinyl transferase superfamily protein [Lyngbya sp. HA4199-MV5]|jgi:4'-phosphopantetheinyl transferase|nr:4'-phosphopantetheinyl transferase superfamily protein [Lyngbya sp. HA4199-MV5]
MVARDWGLVRVSERPATFALGETEIHIWQAGLAVSPDDREQFAQTLSVDEHARADRFRFSRDAHRFIVSRGILRALLGRYLQLPPDQIQFSYSDRGKPSLANPSTAVELTFNLSHSEDWMVCAIARGCRVGIDLEAIHPVPNLADLTQRFFSPREHAVIHTLSDERRLRSFFQHWTCKEALLKATGDGLMSLSTIAVCIEDDQATLVSWSHAVQPVGPWRLQLFAPAPNCVAAIAADSLDRSIVFWQWENDLA